MISVKIDRNLEIEEEFQDLEGWVMWDCPEDDGDDEGGLEAKDKGFGEFYLPSVDLGVNEIFEDDDRRLETALPGGM